MALTNLLDYQAPSRLLADRVILVTGAGDGIGKATALSLAKHGATVLLLGRTLSKLEVTYDEIEQAGGAQPALLPLNLVSATQEEYAQLADTIEKELGRAPGARGGGRRLRLGPPQLDPAARPARDRDLLPRPDGRPGRARARERREQVVGLFSGGLPWAARGGVRGGSTGGVEEARGVGPGRARRLPPPGLAGDRRPRREERAVRRPHRLGDAGDPCRGLLRVEPGGGAPPPRRGLPGDDRRGPRAGPEELGRRAQL